LQPYRARPLGDPPPGQYVELARDAAGGRLGLYVGAGVVTVQGVVGRS
jgi:hypothetical protein